MIKMLTDLKSEIVASKTTEETADAFDQVCYIYSFLKSDLTSTRAHRTTSEHTGPHDVVQRHENCRIENCAHFYFQIQSFGDDFSDEPNESPFDVFAEMENAETEETKVDPFFETGISIFHHLWPQRPSSFGPSIFSSFHFWTVYFQGSSVIFNLSIFLSR